MKGKLFVIVPPLPPAPSGSLGPPPPQPDPKRFGVDVFPGDTFGHIWPRIEDKFGKLYPQEFPFFKIKKLQAYECDLGVYELADDWFDEESDRSKKLLYVVRAPINRNTSVAPNSALQPSNLRKRPLLPAIEESLKRRRIEEEQYGVSIEDMQPDRPIRSREHDTEGLPPGRRATSQGNPDVVVVAGSQREAVPSGSHRDAIHTKTESPDPTPLMEVPEVPSGDGLAAENSLPPQTANFGAFKLPGLPASAAKEPAARGASARRSATPRRRKRSAQMPAFPPRPPWHPSPSPSGQTQHHGPGESVPDTPLPFPSYSQQPERSSRSSTHDGEPDTTNLARTPTPTQPEHIIRKPASIPPAGPTSPILGTPPSAQRPPRSPLASQSIPVESNPDDQASKTLRQRRKRRDEAPEVIHSEQTSSQTGENSTPKTVHQGVVGSSVNGTKSVQAVKSNASRQRSASQRPSDSGNSKESEAAKRALERLQKLTGGEKLYATSRYGKWTPMEDEILILGKEAGILYEEIRSRYLPNRTWKSLSNRHYRLIEGGDHSSRTSEPSVDAAPSTQSSNKPASSPQVPASTGKDSQSLRTRALSPEVRIPYKDMRSLDKEPSRLHAANPSDRSRPSRSAVKEPSSSHAMTPGKQSKSSQSAPKEPSSSHVATSGKQSKSSRSAHEEPSSSHVATSSKQSKSSRSAPKDPSSSQSKSSRKQASYGPSPSQNASEQLEALHQKYVKKKAEKAAAEKKKEACLQRQIKAKKYRDLESDALTRDRRHAEREKQREKEVARQRHREQQELREFRANLYICEQNGLSWSQSSVLLQSDQPLSQSDAGKSTQVRGKQRNNGSQRQIYNISPDSAHQASQKQLRPRRKTDSTLGSMNGADDQQEAADYAQHQESAKRENGNRGTSPSSQLQGAGEHDKMAAAPPPEQDTGEPMQLNRASQVHDGLSNQEAAEAKDTEKALPMDAVVSQQEIEELVEKKVSHKETSKPIKAPKASSKHKRPTHHSASLTTHNPGDDLDSFSDSDSITSPEPESKPNARAMKSSSARQKTPPATNPPTFESEELSNDLNPASYVPSSPSDDADEAPPSSPPAMHNGVDENRQPSPASSSSSDSEDSSDSEASDVEVSMAATTKDVESKPSVAPAHQEEPESPGVRFRGDPSLKSFSELKATLKRVEVPKPVVEAPLKKPVPVADSSSSDESSSDSSDDSDTDDTEKNERRKRRRERSMRKTRNGFQRLINMAANVTKPW